MGRIARNQPGQKYDPELGTVYIFNTAGSIPLKLDPLIDERIRTVMVTDHTVWPQTDFLITTSSLTADIERFAARHNSMPVVLPEGGPWLWEQIGRRTAGGGAVHLRIFNRTDLEIQ